MLDNIVNNLAILATIIILSLGFILAVKSVVDKDVPLYILSNFAMSISVIALIALFTAPVEPKKFCLTINDTQQTVSNFEINTRYIFYWGDNEAGETEQYRVPSVATNIYFVEGECENGK